MLCFHSYSQNGRISQQRQIAQEVQSSTILSLHIFQKTSFLRWLAALQAALPVAVAVFWYCVHVAVKRLAVDRIEIRKIDRQAIQRFVLRTFLQQSSDLIRYYLCTALYCIAAHTANQAALNAASQGQEFTLRFDRVSHSRFGAPNFLVALPVHFSTGNHCVNLWKFLTETGRHSAIPCAAILYGVCIWHINNT